MYRPSEDDFIATGAIASAEPFAKPDHKAKKHGRPRRIKKWPGFPGARPREVIGGGHFVFKRGKRTGRIENRGIPFEHETLESALNEAARLTVEHGGRFDVYSRICGAESVE